MRLPRAYTMIHDHRSLAYRTHTPYTWLFQRLEPPEHSGDS